jgi:hypothetical protein
MSWSQHAVNEGKHERGHVNKLQLVLMTEHGEHAAKNMQKIPNALGCTTTVFFVRVKPSPLH